MRRDEGRKESDSTSDWKMRKVEEGYKKKIKTAEQEESKGKKKEERRVIKKVEGRK